jgi:hypothetical protein
VGLRLLAGARAPSPRTARRPAEHLPPVWQCKEHYAHQDELLAAAAKFRQLGIPLDAIVQDWRATRLEPPDALLCCCAAVLCCAVLCSAALLF